jgi:hypothetical protein
MELKRHYYVCCKILSYVIKEAKRIHDKKFQNQIINVKPLGISLRSYLVNNILKLIYKK